MKADAILKAIANAEGRGMATEKLSGLPEGGKPSELPVQPEPEAMGPPDTTPPVDTGEIPEFDEATGLPVIPMENAPQSFPAEPESYGQAEDILDFIFS
ncbi:hypothetical protein [Boseongicola aestuarii]|uniref:Uncharacterized protein n=1 Tax=Boseongicola aestuarii TaxID=1470561 RepID=A0A238J2D4_9RHOB|nr:hypothetical protein [Boseongicola aestuarii]SMX24064.1 hypothetical protein BOA8489_02179 [Boseongicola aestuarii]